MGHLTAALAAFFRWWGGELAALVPAVLRRELGRGAGMLVLDVSGGDIAVHRISGGAARELGRVPAMAPHGLAERDALFRLLGGAKARRPPPKPEKEAPKPVPLEPVNARLLGVVITPEERTALVGLPEVSGITVFSIGQRLEGWLLEKILPDRIILRRGGQEQEVEIERDIEPAATMSRPRKKRGTRTKPRPRRRLPKR